MNTNTGDCMTRYKNNIIKWIDASKNYQEIWKSKQKIVEKADLFEQLPDELVLIIVNKLDEYATLSRFTATCKRFFQLLPQIRSVSTSLPFYVLKSEFSLIWYTRLFPPDFKRYHPHLKLSIEQPSLGVCRLNPFHAHVVLQIYKSWQLKNHEIQHKHAISLAGFCRNSVSNSRFFERFTSLDSLVVTLETPASEACYIGHASPNNVFRWDAEFCDTGKLPKGYIAVVLGNVVRHDLEGENIEDEISNDLVQLYKALTHVFFHRSTAGLLLSKAHSNLRSIVTKDAGKEGKLRLYRSREPSSDKAEDASYESLKESWLGERRLRLKLCYTPTSLKVNESLEIKDAAFLFLSWVEEDDTTDIDDLIGTCLGLGRTIEDDDRKELKEIVMKILTDEKSQKYVGLQRP